MLHILDLQENRSVIVIVHSKSFLGRKKKKSKLTVALIPKKTLPSAGFSRQCDSSKQPGHPVPGQPAAVHVDPSPSSAAGGYCLSKAMAVPSSCAISSETEVIFSHNCASYL